MMGKVELNGYYTYKIIFQCPYIGVFAFVKIHELAGKPVVAPSMRIFTFIKFFFVFGIGLPADLNALT